MICTLWFLRDEKHSHLSHNTKDRNEKHFYANIATQENNLHTHTFFNDICSYRTQKFQAHTHTHTQNSSQSIRDSTASEVSNHDCLLCFPRMHVPWVICIVLKLEGDPWRTSSTFRPPLEFEGLSLLWGVGAGQSSEGVAPSPRQGSHKLPVMEKKVLTRTL